MKIKIEELKKLTHKSLLIQGYKDEEATIIQDVLLYAQLRGNNQGVVKLIGKGVPKNPNAGEIKIVKETKLSALIDGGQNMGMIVVKKGLEMLLQKAKDHGFGMVGTNNTSSSTGAIGYWANEIAKQGFIGFVYAGSPETVAMHGSYEPIFGTNPLAIGIPSESEPVVLDMATAAMSYYGLIQAKTAGQQLPPGITYDKEGKETTDPGEAMDGAIKSFGGHKGAGLAFMVEVLTGPLVQAAFVGIGQENNWGNLLMAIDPELLTDRETFKKNISEMVQKVKATKKLPGVKEIYVPGERGNVLTRQRLDLGEIEIEDKLLDELRRSGTKFS